MHSHQCTCHHLLRNHCYRRIFGLTCFEKQGTELADDIFDHCKVSPTHLTNIKVTPFTPQNLIE